LNARTPAIKLQRSRPYDRQQALNEDPRVIEPWFKLVRKTKEKYDIQDKDTHNFDKSGFIIGMICAQMVFTGSEEQQNPKKIQPGNRD
jgi:RecB family endonuclease NucS